MFFSGIADESGIGIEAQIATHRELGWDHLELRMVDGVNICEMPDESFQRVQAAVEASGLKVSAFGSAIANWSRNITGDFEIDRHEMETAIPRMKAMGVNMIRVMSWRGEGVDEEAWGNEAVQRFQTLAAMASDGGVTLGLENCCGYANLSPAHYISFIERIGSPTLKALYDTGNPAAYGYETWPFYQALKPHIAYVHIKANCGPSTDGTEGAYVYPDDDASVSLVRETLEDLASSGYDGCLSIEPHMGAVIHKGERTVSDEELKATYMEYGRRLAGMAEKAADKTS